MGTRLPVAVLALLALLALPSAAGAATITRVVDGDTVKVGTTTVRLIGIDTPEVHVGVECGGPQASAYAKRFEGRRVRLRTDPTQATYDHYGRLLAYVDLVGGGSMNAKMIRSGWANVYVYNGVPFQRVRPFRRAQTRARTAGRGVWGRCGGDFHSGR
jgi:endonuclease YncB( thermonuclease family)